MEKIGFAKEQIQNLKFLFGSSLAVKLNLIVLGWESDGVATGLEVSATEATTAMAMATATATAMAVDGEAPYVLFCNFLFCLSIVNSFLILISLSEKY